MDVCIVNPKFDRNFFNSTSHFNFSLKHVARLSFVDGILFV